MPDDQASGPTAGKARRMPAGSSLAPPPGPAPDLSTLGPPGDHLWWCRRCSSDEGLPYRRPKSADARCNDCDRQPEVEDVMIDVMERRSIALERQAAASTIKPGIDAVPFSEAAPTPSSLTPGRSVTPIKPAPSEKRGRSSAPSVTEVATRLRCGRNRVFELLKSGELKRAKRVGRKTMVTTASVESLERRLFASPTPRRRTNRPETPPAAAVAPSSEEMRAALKAQRAALFPAKRRPMQTSSSSLSSSGQPGHQGG
jgi:hypothetical protein